MPQPRKVTPEAREEIEAVGHARATLATDKDLIARHGISRARIHQIMLEARQRLKVDICADSTWNNLADTDPPLEDVG